MLLKFADETSQTSFPSSETTDEMRAFCHVRHCEPIETEIMLGLYKEKARSSDLEATDLLHFLSAMFALATFALPAKQKRAT